MLKYLCILLLLPIFVLSVPPTDEWCDSNGWTDIASLPDTISGNNVCYRLTGNLNSNTDGIYINTATNCRFDLGGYRINFGRDEGNNHIGLKFGNNSHDIIITNGTIRWDGDYAGDTTGESTKVVYFPDNAWDIEFRACTLRVGGYTSQCVDYSASDDRIWNHKYAHVVFTNNVSAFRSRGALDGHTMRFGALYWDGFLTEDSIAALGDTLLYHLKFDTCKITTAPAGWDFGGKSFAYCCSLTIDTRNDFYTYYDDDAYHSFANVGGMGLSRLQPGSEIAYNYVTPGTQYKGCDEAYIIYAAQGGPTGDILIHDNHADSMRIGKDPHYGITGLWPKGFKFRWGNSGVRLYNNRAVSVVGDTTGSPGGSASDGESWATHNRAGVVISYNTGWTGDSQHPDSNIWIYGNYFRIDTLAASGIHVAANGVMNVFISSGDSLAFNMMGDFGDWDDYNINWYGNTIEGCGVLYEIGGGDGRAQGIIIRGDTIIHHDTTVTNAEHYLSWAASEILTGQVAANNYFQDMYYISGNETNLYTYPGKAGLLQLGLKRTLEITVTDGGSPAEGIEVRATNNYGYTYYDTTDAEGMAYLAVKYYEIFDDITDSTSFNNFTIETDDSTIVETISWDNYAFNLTGTTSSPSTSQIIIIGSKDD